MRLPRFLPWWSARNSPPVLSTTPLPVQPSQEPLAFREAQDQDVLGIAELYDAEVANGHFISTGVQTASFFGHAVRHGRVRISSSAGNYDTPVLIDVALRDGELVGFTTIKAWIDPELLAANTGGGETRGSTQEVELWMLVVAPAERRRGTGTVLLERQLAKAASLVGKRGEAVARCAPASAGAKSLLLKQGFAVEVSRPTGELLRRRFA